MAGRRVRCGGTATSSVFKQLMGRDWLDVIGRAGPTDHFAMRVILIHTLKLLICLCFLSMAGCVGNSARFLNPLIEPENAELPLDLCGHWQLGTYSDEDATVVIAPAGENFPPGFVQICGLSTDESEFAEETTRFMIGFINQIQGECFFNQPISIAMGDGSSHWLDEWDETNVIGYRIWKFSTDGRFLEMIPASIAPMRQAIEENRLPGQITISDDENVTVLVTASSESLREFFQQTPELFDPIEFAPQVSITIGKKATANLVNPTSSQPLPWWIRFAPLAAGCGFGIGLLICLMIRSRSNR